MDGTEILKPDLIHDEMMITDQNGRPLHVDPRSVVMGDPNVPAGLPGLMSPQRQQRPPVNASRLNVNPPERVAPNPTNQGIPPGYGPANPVSAPQFRKQQNQQNQQPYYDQPYEQPQHQPQQPHPQRRQQLPVPFFEIYTDKSIGAYNLYVDLPGVEHDSINIEYTEEGNAVTITGTRISIVDKLKAARTGRAKNKELSIEESHSTIPSLLMGEFVFSLPFTKSIDPQNIRMEYIDGVLWVQLPHRVKGEKVVISLKKQKTVEDVG